MSHEGESDRAGRRRISLRFGVACGLAVVAALASETRAAGSRVLPKSDGSPDGL